MTIREIVAALLLASAIASPAMAQQTQQATPLPGSPAATITIPGDQLPPALQKFEGKIERDAKDSKPFGPREWCLPKARRTFC